jgi:hypothetical protein
MEEIDAEITDYAADYLTAEPEDLKNFDFSMWKLNEPPILTKDEFTGRAGVQHTLPPESAKHLIILLCSSWSSFTANGLVIPTWE